MKNVKEITKRIENEEWLKCLKESFNKNKKDIKLDGFRKGSVTFELYTKKLGLKNVELKVYEGMRHEILNEVDHEKVYKDVLEFIEK